jgi:fructose-1-phosphate kinase PfkB-like protein
MKSILTLTMNPAIDAGVSVMRVYSEHELHCMQVHNDPEGGGIKALRTIDQKRRQSWERQRLL